MIHNYCVTTYVTCITYIQHIWRQATRTHRPRAHTTPNRYYVYGSRGKRESSIRTKRSTTISRFKRLSTHNKIMCLVASTNCLHTDQNWLGIDTFSTYCMTNNKDDFTTTPTRIHANVTGVSGESTATISLHGPGTFFVMDELGAVCPLQIPDLYYCATVPYRLLSPQHLDKVWRAQGLGTMKIKYRTCGNHPLLD